MTKLQKRRWRDFFAMCACIGVLTLVVVFVNRCQADCTFVWHPGDKTFAEAGRPIVFLVEQEDVKAFLAQKKIDNAKDFLPGEKVTHTDHFCGEYQDLTDVDVE
jgi:hypothetical protein